MTVYLVGAGPGDPGLLTRRGAALLGRADVVVYDRLIDRSLLALAPAEAELIDVGKPLGGSGAEGARRQEEINRLLVQRAQTGATVVRLKGGDPFVFGRGGEELLALRDADVETVVVPGVTSALAVPAAAGIPVTHRGIAASVAVVTGRVGDSGATVDWAALARFEGTIVVLMGTETRAEVARRLIAGGMSPDTPSALIERGTTARQRVVRCRVDELGDAQIGSPSVIVIGAVTALPTSAPPSGPLAGVRVVVTRPAGQSDTLVDALAAAGATVAAIPLVAITDPDDASALEAARARVAQFEWIVFTSANAVTRFLEPIGDLRALGSVKLAAVGPATAAALGRLRLGVDLVAREPSAKGLGDLFGEVDGRGRVLFPRSAMAGAELADRLRAKGWEVVDVVAYETRPVADLAPELSAEVAEADVVTFAAPSAVSAAELLVAGALHRAIALCIGPTTAAAARAAGFAEVVASASPEPGAIVAALGAHLAARVSRPS